MNAHLLSERRGANMLSTRKRPVDRGVACRVTFDKSRRNDGQRCGHVSPPAIVPRVHFTSHHTRAMLDSIVAFDVPTRVRELELSITRRLRDTIRPHVHDSAELERVTRDLLVISRDLAGSYEAINNRARIREEQTVE